MRKPLVAGNWKMFGSQQSVTELLESLCGQWRSGFPVEMALFPPFVYLAQAATTLEGSGIALGSQNLSQHENGAFTGEISGSMLQDFGCRYAIVGHSERRGLYGETDDIVAEKFATAQALGLIPILCVGETLDQRQKGETHSVIACQVDAVIDRVGLEHLAKAVIAYEPVWAIGTGMTATPDQAQNVHAAIRERLGGHGAETRIIYGGSVKAANAEELFGQQDIDGGLVGGASLDANEFIKIVKQADLY